MATKLNAIAVFCGSSTGLNAEYTQAAVQLGRLLAQRHISLVYGGAQVGLMGSLANAVLAEGGQVVGVIPKLLMRQELVHSGLTELQVVATLAERKELMMARSDAFIALPGGIGTLDELFEVWTTHQLGLHGKPVGLLNTAGYFNSLLTFIEHAMAQGFLRAAHASLLQVHAHPQQLLSALANQ